MLIILFIFSIFNVFTITTNSKIIINSQNLILITRIFIDFSFFMIILIIKTITTINNNNSSNYKLLKNNNVRYLKFINLYKSLAKTQTNLSNKINFVNKTQTFTIIIKIRSNFTITNFNDDR